MIGQGDLNAITQRLTTSPAPMQRPEQWYRAVWRWHFYAGLFCVPFVLWLSLTGAVYLFKPQIEHALYAPYRDVVSGSGPRLSAEIIARKAVAAVPGSILHKYVLPDNNADAVEVLVGQGSDDVRVWVHPQTGDVLYQVPEEDRLMRVIFRLHGELLAGEWGSALIEIAACWTVVMLLSGLFLWWPRHNHGVAGILYPRLRASRAVFWRDIHAVTGFWVTLGALFLIASGLPWANAWGAYFQQVRAVTGTLAGPQDWSISSAKVAQERAHSDHDMRAMMSDHAEHGGMSMMHMPPAAAALDRVVEQAQSLGFAAPVEVSPPTGHNGYWNVRSQADNRPTRDSAEVASGGQLVGIQRFSQRHWIDRAVGYGVAIHEGAWAGIANQLLNLAVLMGLVLLSLSSVVLWWRRRPQRKLGAPAAMGQLRHSWALVILVLMMAVAMPMFGMSLAVVVVFEAGLKRLFPRLRHWMGWRDGVAPTPSAR